jgi:FlaA1/EpsC-like NDP-sugar epimerase
MHARLPASRVVPLSRFSPIDVAWSALSPLLALYLRNGNILSVGGVGHAAFYILISLSSSLIALAAFRVHAAMPRYLSVPDLADLAKTVILSELLTFAVLFTLGQLQGVPRSTPVIHGLLLWAGLVAARACVSMADKRGGPPLELPPAPREHVVLIGLNDLSVCFLRCAQALARDRHRVIAVLDREPRWIGRTVRRVAVMGQPRHLGAIIEEFAIHGVQTDRVVVGGAPDILSQAELVEISRVCASRALSVEFLAPPFNLFVVHAGNQANRRKRDVVTGWLPAGFEPCPFFRAKRLIDIAAALLLIVVLLPG